MKTIQVKDSFSTGLDSSLEGSITQINLKDGCLGFGGFGEVFEVVGLNGKQSKLPLVAKVLYTGKERNYQNVIALQKLVKNETSELKKTKQYFFDIYPSLIALPLLSFQGDIDRKAIKGYLSLDLNKLGFLNAETFFKTNSDHWVQLQNRPLFFKYKIAYALAKGCSFLRKIHFIHADITPDNLFLHTTAPLCALIDFDSGAIITSFNDAPTTEGKHYSEWEAPELTCDNPKINKLTAFADDWALAITLHRILTGWNAFFTKYCSYSALEKWRKMYDETPELQWPKISDKPAYANLFNKDGLAYMDIYMKCYEPIDTAIKKGFQTSFVKGSIDYLKRWDSNKWVAILEKSIENCKPNTAKTAIDYFEKMEQTVRGKFPDEQVNAKVFPLLNTKSTNVLKNAQKPIVFHNEVSTSSTTPLSPTKRLMDSYIEELLPDLINGKVSIGMHKGFISKYARENGFEAEQYLKDLQDFVKLFKESIKDKVVTQLEYTSFILQGKMLNIKREVIDQFLKTYKRK